MVFFCLHLLRFFLGCFLLFDFVDDMATSLDCLKGTIVWHFSINLNNFIEEFFQIIPSFSTNLIIQQTQLFCFCLPLSLTYLTSFNQINFIANQYGETLSRFVVLVQVQPSIDIVERCPGGDIKDYERTVSIPEIARDERLEPFLSCCVPNLNTVVLVLIGNILGQKINADCWLFYPICTLEVSSNLSLT